MRQKIQKIIEIPEQITANIDNKTVKIEFNGKTNEKVFKAKDIDFELIDKQIILTAIKRKKNLAMMNTFNSLIKNMIKGVQDGFEYRLVIVYSHFPMNVSVKDKIVEVNNFAGEKKIRKAKIVGQTTVEIKGKDVFVKGNSKEHVSQTAANIENTTKVKGKDRRIFQDGIYITLKGVKA